MHRTLPQRAIDRVRNHKSLAQIPPERVGSQVPNLTMLDALNGSRNAAIQLFYEMTNLLGLQAIYIDNRLLP